jgi:hypothetical protein
MLHQEQGRHSPPDIILISVGDPLGTCLGAPELREALPPTPTKKLQ